MPSFHIMSDLHLEFGPWDPPTPKADYAILAGDIHLRKKGLDWAKEKFPSPVIYINGNHEYYKNSYRATLAEHKDLNYPNIHFLEDSYLSHIPLFGATLWTDFNLDNDPRRSKIVAAGMMNDYHLIKWGVDENGFSTKLTPDQTTYFHYASVAALESFLSSHPKAIVVTHHAPSPKSIDPAYHENPLNAAYASNLEDLIHKYKPALWVHGHTHHSFDYIIGDTRIICNPRGYKGSFNLHFNPTLVIDIP